MARLEQLQAVLQETGAALAQYERALALDPDSPSLAVVGKSLRKRHEQLRAEFFHEASRTETDVCTYRVFSSLDKRYTVDAVTSTLQAFQRLFTVVYDALKGFPKETAHIGSAVAEEAEFGFAYMLPGSISMVLTLPRALDLFGNSYFEDAINKIFAMVRSQAAGDVLEFSKQVGVAAVRQMYRWADSHTRVGFGADIQWRGGRQSDETRLVIQVPQINNLRNIISQSSESKDEDFEVRCDLIGADLDRRSFHLRTVATEQDIHGTFSDAITHEQRAELPARYIAKLRRTRRIFYSTDQEQETYFLLSLTPS